MSLTPKIAMSDDFLKSFAAVPRSSQHAVLTFVAKFRQNPMATGINYERINNAGDPNMRSVRINDNLRGIVLKPDVGNVYCLLWVDTHDDAYQWAGRHRVAIHPDVGSIQVYAVQETQGDVSSNNASLPETIGLYHELKDREIRRLGVPDEMLAVVRAIGTVDELEAIETQLPDEAFESLYLYAAGDSYDSIINSRDNPHSVDQTDYSAALERDSSKRHFVVITDDSDLEALLAAPLERWRVFLHPSQRKLIERDWNGPVKVTGGAGTGKTVVAMHRAARLARQYAELPGRPIVFTTFTKTLAEDIKQHLALLCTPQELEKIQVVNIDQWASSILRRFGYPHNLLYSEVERRKMWQAAMSALPASVEFSLQFMRAEYERVVLPLGCESAEDYMRASRVGRGGQIGRSVRKSIWPVFAEYRAQLQAANLREPEDAFREAVQILRVEKPSLGIRAMVVDEAQDISPSGFDLIRTSVPEAENDIFIVGDAHQRIYRHKVVLNRVGISVRGRSKSLKVNYRTTDEIRRWACAQLEGCEVDDLDGDVDTLRGYHSLTHGDFPAIIESRSAHDDFEHIQDLLKKLNDDCIEARQICIVARTNEDIEGLGKLLVQTGIPSLKLDGNTADNDTTSGVRLATMHRIKGLEFSVVIIASYRGAQEYARQFSQDEDAGVTEETEMSERCLLHVAATRAKRNLFLLKR
ncbi:UvrD-helicase domain-containing protein [Undibacterium sp. Ji50W]|uniref:UvrD-helicase domain-containing protein n=1 Tax=Undibacterium sp. Ji50W TaxID=3413041 RepID=UPI003BF295C8